MEGPGLVTVMAPSSPRVLTTSVFCCSLCGLHSQGHLMIQDGCCSNHVHILACRKQEERWACFIPFKTLCRSFTQKLQRSWEVQSSFRMTTCPVKNWEFCYWGGRELLGDKKQSLHRNQLYSVHIYAINFKLNAQHGPEILILQYFPSKLAFPLFILPKSSLMSLNPSLSWCLCLILCRENRCGRVTSHCLIVVCTHSHASPPVPAVCSRGLCRKCLHLLSHCCLCFLLPSLHILSRFAFFFFLSWVLNLMWPK